MLSSNAPMLIVDDDPACQDVIEKILKAMGYTNITLAGNGKDAIEQIKKAMDEERMFRIIFLDWNMPEMDGLAFLKICRSDLSLKDVAIVMITAFTDQKSLILALGSGATTYITKPIVDEVLERKVEQIANWIDT